MHILPAARRSDKPPRISATLFNEIQGRQGSKVAAFNLPLMLTGGGRRGDIHMMIQMERAITRGTPSIRESRPLGCKPSPIFRIQRVNQSDLHLSPALTSRCGVDGVAGVSKKTPHHLADAETDVGVGA